MGWGLEAVWGQSSRRGEVALGIVDAVTIDHLHPPGFDYDTESAREELRELQAAAELDSWDDTLRVNLATWRRGRRRPPSQLRQQVR